MILIRSLTGPTAGVLIPAGPYVFPGTWLTSSKFAQHAVINKPKTGQGLTRERTWGKAARDIHTSMHLVRCTHTHPAEAPTREHRLPEEPFMRRRWAFECLSIIKRWIGS